MNTNSNSFRITLTLGITIVAVGGFIFLAVFPLLSRIQETQNQIRENKQNLGRIAQDIANYKALSIALARESETKEALMSMFPIREEMVGLVEGLEVASDRSGLEPKLTLTDVKEVDNAVAARTKPAGPLISGLTKIEEVPFTLEASGTYSQLIDLFLNLEHSFFFPEISKIAVTTESTQAGPEGEVVNTGQGIARLDGVLFIKQP